MSKFLESNFSPGAGQHQRTLQANTALTPSVEPGPVVASRISKADVIDVIDSVLAILDESEESLVVSSPAQ